MNFSKADKLQLLQESIVHLHTRRKEFPGCDGHIYASNVTKHGINLNICAGRPIVKNVKKCYTRPFN